MKKQLADIKLIFISTDPERDTPEEIEKYSQYFLSKYKDKVIGATGSIETLEEVAHNYQAGFRKIFSKDNSKSEYSMAHTTALFLFKKNNEFYKRIRYLEADDFLYQSIVEMNP